MDISFDDWLSLSWDTERENAEENRKRWDGFRGTSHTEGTLLHYARLADPGFLVRRRGRSDYSASTATPEELANALSLPLPKDRWFQAHVVTTDKGWKILSSMENFEAMIRYYGIKIWEDLMAHEIKTNIPGKVAREGKVENAAFGILKSIAEINRFKQEAIENYAIVTGHENANHPVRDYLDNVPDWDGEDRIKAIVDKISLTTQYTSSSLAYTLLRRWLISCVASVYEKGFRNRGVLVLQGPEQIGKTTFFKSLLPKAHYSDWFGDGKSVDPNSKDSRFEAISKWIVELGELEGVFRKSDKAALKAFLTTETDEVRRPYERKAERYPRRTVFCATVNKLEFLDDDTGHSRYWIIAVQDIGPMDWLDIDQLWSQAIQYYTEGEQWWLRDEEDAALKISNKSFHEADPFADEIIKKFQLESLKVDGVKLEAYSVSEIAQIIGFDKPDHKTSRSIGNALRNLGIESKVRDSGSKGYGMPPRRAEDFSGLEILEIGGMMNEL